MQNLFHLISPIGQGILKFPEWLYVRDGLKRNLDQVMRFYRNNPMAVQSSHFLVRLLHSINIPQSQLLERYFSNVDAASLNISMALKMTSSIFRGEIFNGVFYGPGNSEILIAHSESFDIFAANRNWESLIPVKVLRHPRSDLALNIPDGTNTGSENGIAVISINIPMLAIQYRAFRLNEILKTDDEFGTQKSIMQFIHMYVLPNMLYSHLDYALFNRIDNLRKGAPLGESRKNHSFPMPDFAQKSNRVQTEILFKLAQVGRDFTGILRTVPTVTSDDMEQLFLVPDMASTRQVIWALVIARLPALVFLFRLLQEGPRRRNQNEVNQVMRDMLRYKSDNLMRTMLPLELFFEVQEDINKITDPTFTEVQYG
jgi:hypothetical protein